MEKLTPKTELEELLTAAKQALDGIVALDDEDAGPDGESLACSEIVKRIDAYISKQGRADA